ncbi:MAG TPA: ATP-binding protein [Sedimentisphaerales bacterium]|nr:ATP-binding protein [Sedimentisphaerales bacterium]
MKLRAEKRLKILALKGRLINSALLRRLARQLESLVGEIRFAESLDGVLSLSDLSCFDVLLLDLNLARERCLETLSDLRKRHPRVGNIVITSECGDVAGLVVVAQGTHEFMVGDGCNTDAFYDFIRHSIEREQTYEVLDQKQKSLQAIFDAVPIGMLLVDEEMTVKRVNDAIRQITGKEFAQILGKPVAEALSCIHSGGESSEGACGLGAACEACELRRTIQKVLDEEHPVHQAEFHSTLTAQDGQGRPWFSISAEPTRIDGHKYVVVAIDDVTDRKEAEQRLKETMEMKSQFISTVSHELRTPLACMKEAIAVVLAGAAGGINDKQKTFLDIASRNIDRLAVLINNVLDFQKLEAGMMELNLRENEVGEIVRDACTTMASLAGKKCIDLTVKVADDLSKVRFDADKIIQVLTNLISNAIKFTPEHGRVSVCAVRRGEELAISVSDTGVGVPKDALARIFDRFYRIERPGKQVQGTGLGLAIVHRIVMMHGGRIEVESTVDQGSTFTVFLPLQGESTPADAAATTGHVVLDR